MKRVGSLADSLHQHANDSTSSCHECPFLYLDPFSRMLAYFLSISITLFQDHSDNELERLKKEQAEKYDELEKLRKEVERLKVDLKEN